MKDALGHGSDPHGGEGAAGAHAQGVQQVGRPVSHMQRRQFEAIAGAINHYPDATIKPDLAQHFADALRGTNPNFDAGKFKNAAMTGNMGRTQNKDPDMQRRHFEAVASTIAESPGVDAQFGRHAFRGRVGSHECEVQFGPDLSKPPEADAKGTQKVTVVIRAAERAASKFLESAVTHGDRQRLRALLQPRKQRINRA